MVLLQKTLPIEQANHYAYTHHGEEHYRFLPATIL